jgi:Tfp pilus assembly protein PilX
MRSQRGVSLIIALIMLVGMMVAGISMFRKISSGAILAGNLTFTSSAITAADQGSEAGRAWLMAQSATSLYSVVAPGYFPASCYITNSDPGDCSANPPPATFNPATFDWTNNSVLVTAADDAGNEVRYLIHRLCGITGSLSTVNQSCVFTSTTSSSSHDDEKHLTTTVTPYYRVTTRVRGPRNTVAYTQLTMF